MPSDPNLIGKDLQQVTFVGGKPDRLYDDSGIRIPHFSSKLKLELGKDSQWSDRLYISTGHEISLVINQKLKNIFDRFSLCRHRYIDVTVVDEKEGIEQEYYWLILDPDSGIEYINFRESAFDFVEHYTTIETVQFSNKSEFLKFRKERFSWKHRLKGNKVLLDYVALPDLFVLSPFDFHVHVKRELSDEIRNQNITGLDIKNRQSFLLLE